MKRLFLTLGKISFLLIGYGHKCTFLEAVRQKVFAESRNKNTMDKLNLPEYQFRMKMEEGKPLIFDVVRKRFVALTPEEWVRQNFIQYLKTEKKYPESLMAVEKQISVNKMQRRFDLLVYLRNGQPHLIAEFKAPNVKITQETFDQVVRYNMALRVETVIVSNGLQHFVCQIDYANNSYAYLREVPEFCDPSRAGGQELS